MLIADIYLRGSTFNTQDADQHRNQEQEVNRLRTPEHPPVLKRLRTCVSDRKRYMYGRPVDPSERQGTRPREREKRELVQLKR